METMPMMWMPMPGQTWLGAAASFLGMWTMMTAAMMLPSMAPLIWRYRRALEARGVRRDAQTARAGLSYLFVWIALGAVVFSIGAAVVSIGMRHPTLAHVAPIATGAVVIAAGALQLTTWKLRLLTDHDAPGRTHVARGSPNDAWRHGLRLGLRCAYSCSGLMAIQLVVGMMDLRVMGVITAAITVERLAPAGERVARFTGSVAVAIGVALIARAMT